MRWHGKTKEQREAGERWGFETFAVLPVQFEDGTWAWLEWVWCRRIDMPNARHRYVYAGTFDSLPRAPEPTRPPAPTPTRAPKMVDLSLCPRPSHPTTPPPPKPKR